MSVEQSELKEKGDLKNGSEMEVGGGDAISKKLRDYVLEHPGTALSMSMLTAGGLLLLFYFIRIGFLPDIALESAATLLYAVSIFGLFTLAVLALYTVLPALIVKAWWHDYKTQGGLTKEYAVILSGGAQLLSWISTLLILVRESSNGQQEIWFFGFLPLGVFTAASFVLALYLICHPKQADSNEDKGAGQSLSESEEGKGAEPSSENWWHRHSGAFMVAGTALVQWCLLSLVLWMTIGLGAEGMRHKEGMDVFVALALPIFLGVAIQFLLLGLKWDQVLPWAAGSGAISLALILMVTQSFSQPSANIVAKLGVGEVSFARLVLNGKGCKQLNLALGGVHCGEVKDEEPTALCPVTLRSRIGSQVLIEVAPMQLFKDEVKGKEEGKEVVRVKEKLVWIDPSEIGEAHRQRVILDKSALLAWSVLSPTAKPQVDTKNDTSGSQKSKSENNESASLVYRRVFNAPNAASKTSTDAAKLENALLDLCGAPPPVKLENKDGEDKKKPLITPPAPPKPLPPKHADCCCGPVSARVIAPACPENAKAEM